MRPLLYIMRKSQKKITTAAPTLNLITKLSKEENSTHAELHRLITAKYTRSISSFGNPIRESPQKKKTIFHQKVKSGLQKSGNGATQNIAGVFASIPKTDSEEEIVRDILDRFHVCRKIVAESTLVQGLSSLIKNFQAYLFQIVNKLFELNQDRLTEYSSTLASICAYYDQRLKKERQETIASIQKGIEEGTSSLGKRIIALRQNTEFNCKVFNQMERSGIDVRLWIINSDTILQHTKKQQLDEMMCKSQKTEEFYTKYKDYGNEFEEEVSGTEEKGRMSKTHR